MDTVKRVSPRFGMRRPLQSNETFTAFNFKEEADERMGFFSVP